MSSRRIIRPIRTSGSVESVGVELNLEDVRALSKQMVQDARRRVAELQEEQREVEVVMRKTREDEERAAAERREALEKELVERRQEYFEGLEEEREARLESGRKEGLEAGKREGYEKGYGDGREAGYREGRENEIERLRTDTEKVGPALRAILDEFTARKHEFLQRARVEVVRLAVEIARRVIKREVREFRDDIVLENVRQALDLIFLRNKITVQIHQDDLPAIERFAREVIEPIGSVDEFEIRPVTDLEPGGCRVLSGTGLVDLSLETQIEIIEQALIGECGDDSAESTEEREPVPVEELA